MSFSVLLLLAATADPAAAKSHDPGKRIRCVREDVIGSLATKRRVCHTLEEWERIRKGGNDEARRVFQPGTLNDTNN